MNFPKQIKDIVYDLLQEPTLDKFRVFLHGQTGEHNSIDFKSKWIEGASLAKEMLALANSGGGIIVFGIAENEDKTPRIDGLPEIRDKAVISNEIKNFISSNIEYEVYDFSYTTSEYELLKGKKLQMLVVKDTPERIPFLAEKESGSLKQNMIYVRRGTSCEVANQEELNNILNRRINFMHPLNGEPLELKEHLNQLKTLYESTEKNTVHYNRISSEWTKKLLDAATEFTFGKRIEDPNPFYPEEAYDAFVARMISEKKKKIERVLDLY